MTSMLLVATSSRADDVKAFHGASCQPKTDDHDWDGADEWSVDQAGLQNYEEVRNGVAAIYICPLVRDRVSATNTLESVTIEGYNYEDTFACTLFSQTEDYGGATYDSHNQSTSGTGNVQLSSFSVATTNGTEGSYSLLCGLGYTDRIYQVHLRENNGVD
jgi:hypothetical protein